MSSGAHAITAQGAVDFQNISLELTQGKADSKANSLPWGTLTRRVASVFASTTDEECDTEDESNVEEEVVQQFAPSFSAAATSHPQPLTPAPLGAKLCRCQGEVLVVFGHYGWLTTSQWIDHPAATRNGGRIYFHVRDVVDSVSLVRGDRVDFYLYVDEQGLGAEGVSLQPWDAGQCSSRVGMNPGATEFVPKAYSGPPVAAVLAPQLDVFALNLAYLSGSSDTDSSAESEVDQRGDWTDGADSESSVVACKGQPAGLQRKLLKKKSRTHSHGSSSTGSPSGSEICALDGPPPGLLHPNFRPPPGLSLTLGSHS